MKIASQISALPKTQTITLPMIRQKMIPLSSLSQQTRKSEAEINQRQEESQSEEQLRIQLLKRSPSKNEWKL